jgi:hypothetical protein
MMPAMAAAYATIGREQVPRATPTLNVLQRVGGSLGTAVLAVVLQRQIVAQLGGAGGGPGAGGGGFSGGGGGGSTGTGSGGTSGGVAFLVFVGFFFLIVFALISAYVQARRLRKRRAARARRAS